MMGEGGTCGEGGRGMRMRRGKCGGWWRGEGYVGYVMHPFFHSFSYVHERSRKFKRYA